MACAHELKELRTRSAIKILTANTEMPAYLHPAKHQRLREWLALRSLQLRIWIKMNAITEINSYAPQHQEMPQISAFHYSVSLQETMPAMFYSAHLWPPTEHSGIAQAFVSIGLICRY